MAWTHEPSELLPFNENLKLLDVLVEEIMQEIDQQIINDLNSFLNIDRFTFKNKYRSIDDDWQVSKHEFI